MATTVDERAAQAQERITAIAAGVAGTLGMAAWPVGEPQRAIGLRMDESFPTASTFKIPLLYALYQMVDRGEVNLDERVEIAERHRVPGSGVLQDLDLGLQPTIRDLSILMTVVSDNQATDMLYAIVGEQRINAAVAALGLRSIETPINCRELLYDYVGMDINNPEHTYAMFLERARAGEYNRAGKAFSDQPGSGNDLDLATRHGGALRSHRARRRTQRSGARGRHRHHETPEIHRAHPRRSARKRQLWRTKPARSRAFATTPASSTRRRVPT